MIRQTLSFEDVLLVPKYSEIKTRADIDLHSSINNVNLRLPILSAPMDTITGDRMATTMCKSLGAMGIIHRYNSVYEQSDMAWKAIDSGATNVCGAVGVTGDYIERAEALFNVGCRAICVDIAHGHHVLMKDALLMLRNRFEDSIDIIAGNVATLEGFNDLSDWGADAIRVGIGGGSICSTRIQTGHGMPTLQSVLDCSVSDRPAKLIADGGLRTSGDISKALAAGADFVMLGSLLSGTEQTPTETIYMHGEKHKVYRGMASKEAQIDWRGHTASVEGVSTTVPYKGCVTRIIDDLERGIRSGLSYSGAKTLTEFHAKATLIRQTQAGAVESSTHIVRG